MSKHKISWRSPSLNGREITLARYGVMGQPLLLFPTAGGDAEEPERFHMVDAIGDFIQDLRLKVYCVDSIAGQAWLQECETLEEAAVVQNRFDAAIWIMSRSVGDAMAAAPAPATSPAVIFFHTGSSSVPPLVSSATFRGS